MLDLNKANNRYMSPSDVGDNSVSLGRSCAKHDGNSSYKPPSASYTVQGPQKQQEISESLPLKLKQNITKPVFPLHSIKRNCIDALQAFNLTIDHYQIMYIALHRAPCSPM